MPQRAQESADAHQSAQAEGRQTSRLQERSPQSSERETPYTHAKQALWRTHTRVRRFS
jgi:hypothetical protein